MANLDSSKTVEYVRKDFHEKALLQARNEALEEVIEVCRKHSSVIGRRIGEVFKEDTAIVVRSEFEQVSDKIRSLIKED